MPPGSSCIANAYTNNHDALAGEGHQHGALAVPARRGRRGAGARHDPADPGAVAADKGAGVLGGALKPASARLADEPSLLFGPSLDFKEEMHWKGTGSVGQRES